MSDIRKTELLVGAFQYVLDILYCLCFDTILPPTLLFFAVVENTFVQFSVFIDCW